MILAHKALPPLSFSSLALFVSSLLPPSAPPELPEAEGDLLIKVSDCPSQSSINTPNANTLA